MGECHAEDKTWLALKRAKVRLWMETTGRQVLAQCKKVGSSLAWVWLGERWRGRGPLQAGTSCTTSV